MIVIKGRASFQHIQILKMNSITIIEKEIFNKIIIEEKQVLIGDLIIHNMVLEKIFQ